MINLSIRRFCTICLFFILASFYSTTVFADAECSCGEECSLKKIGQSIFKKFRTKWILDGLQSFGQDTSADEVIEFGAKVKIEIQKFTGERHHFNALFHEAKKKLKKRHIKLPKGYFDLIIKEIRNYQKFVHHPKKVERPFIDLDLLGMSNLEVIGSVSMMCSVLLADLPIFNCEYISGIAAGIGIDAMLEATIKD